MKSSGPGQPAHLLLDVIEALESLGVSYGVVGGFAASFHGQVRSTNDGDAAIWFEKTELRRQDVLKRLEAAGLQTEERVGASDDPISAVIVIHDSFGNKVDLLIGVRGMPFAAASRTVPATLLGVPIRMIGAEDFVAMKIAAGGHKDLDDVRGVLEVSGEKLNMDLVKKMTRLYGLAEARTLASILKEKRFFPAR